jgi:hypothetical protein
MQGEGGREGGREGEQAEKYMCMVEWKRSVKQIVCAAQKQA